MRPLFVVIPLVALLIIGISVIAMLNFDSNKIDDESDLENKPQFLAEQINHDEKIKLNIKSLFNIYVFENDYEVVNGKKIWQHAEFILKPENEELFEDIAVFDDAQKSIVIFPIFTAAAYDEPGFYTYYRNECDTSCLTVELKNEYTPTFPVSGNAFQVLTSLGYDFLSDIDVDQNPDILKKYDKVILLHNEYVTKNEFDAIVTHPKVLYLYPNALYAEISVDYNANQITLLRGHNFPEFEISNGFDWEFDNSPLEYNTTCVDMGFDKISNGWMLNCYPEDAIHKSKVLLKMIKDF